MFLHLPFAVMATLSPVAVSDTMPAFDIAKECRFESESSALVASTAFERCSKDEADARQKLQEEWSKFVAADKSSCIVETTVGGFANYVELLTCLEMANDVRNPDNRSQGALVNEGSPPIGQGSPEMTVGDERDQPVVQKPKAD